MYCELVGFFVSLGIPPKIRLDGQNGEISTLRYGEDIK